MKKFCKWALLLLAAVSVIVFFVHSRDEEGVCACGEFNVC